CGCGDSPENRCTEGASPSSFGSSTLIRDMTADHRSLPANADDSPPSTQYCRPLENSADASERTSARSAASAITIAARDMRELPKRRLSSGGHASGATV